jgi:hypothetical protein
MEDYYKLISAKILDGYDDIIGKTPQPQMLGGKRMRNFVLPASTEYDYPASLSVGRMDGNDHSKTLGGDFYKDFGTSFPTNSLKGGVHSLERKVGGKINLGKTLKSVGKALKPVAKVALPILKDVAVEAVKSSVKSGGKINLGKTLKSVGKVLKPVAKVLKPVAKEVFEEVLVPEGKKALREYIKSGLGSNEENVGGAMKRPRGRPKKVLEAGALIRNAPKEFHSSVYPPALASYNHELPIQSRGPMGAGRKAKSGAKSKRGEIVKQVMKKHGLSLGEASKFVKENNLY